MAEQVKNSLDNPTSTLAAGITSGALSLTVASGHGARLPATGDFRLKLTDQSDDTLYELVVGTARSSDVVTITRAAEGTTARAFVTGDHVDLVLSAAALTAYVTENSAADADVTASTAASVILAPATSARNVIQPTAGDVIAAVVKAHAAQSVDLTQWQTSAAAVLGKIGSTGCWTIQPSALGLTGAVLIDAGTPPLVGSNEPQRATLNLKATPSAATDGDVYGVRFGSYRDTNFDHATLGKYDWLFDSYETGGDTFPYLTMRCRRLSDRKRVTTVTLGSADVSGSTYPAGDNALVGNWTLGGEFGGDGKSGGLKLWDLNDFLIHETVAGGVATFAFQRVAGVWKYGIFASAPSPVAQQSASDVGALWTALKAYGWLDAGSAAPDLATQAELDAHTVDTSDAHDASAISFSPTGTVAATDVQAAIAEVASEAGGAPDLSAAVILAPAASARNVILPTGATVVPLTLKGFTGQSADLLQTHSEAGAVLVAVSAAGRLKFGADVELWRSAANELKTDDDLVGGTVTGTNGVFVGTGGYTSAGSSSASLLRGTVTGDANYRIKINNLGEFYWGDGTVAPGEISLYRSGVGELILNDRLKIATTNAARTPLTLKGAASQSADLQEWQSSAAAVLAAIDPAGLHKWSSGNEQTTVGAAGGASALPASPTKYLKVKGSDGTTYVVPAYAAA